MSNIKLASGCLGVTSGVLFSSSSVFWLDFLCEDIALNILVNRTDDNSELTPKNSGDKSDILAPDLHKKLSKLLEFIILSIAFIFWFEYIDWTNLLTLPKLDSP